MKKYFETNRERVEISPQKHIENLKRFIKWYQGDMDKIQESADKRKAKLQKKIDETREEIKQAERDAYPLKEVAEVSNE